MKLKINSKVNNSYHECFYPRTSYKNYKYVSYKSIIKSNKLTSLKEILFLLNLSYLLNNNSISLIVTFPSPYTVKNFTIYNITKFI